MRQRTQCQSEFEGQNGLLRVNFHRVPVVPVARSKACIAASEFAFADSEDIGVRSVFDIGEFQH